MDDGTGSGYSGLNKEGTSRQVMKDWTYEIETMRNKIRVGKQSLDEEKKELVMEIVRSLNDKISDIRQELIKLGFEENKDHHSHDIDINPLQNDNRYFWYARWKIYLGMEKEAILFVDLAGEIFKDYLGMFPNLIFLRMPRWNYLDSTEVISIECLHNLFDIWLKEVNKRIVVPGLKELKIKLSLL